MNERLTVTAAWISLILLPVTLLVGVVGDISQVGALHTIASAAVLIWLPATVVALVGLTRSRDLRDRFVRRLANMPERDEREAQVAGRAARDVFFRVVPLLLFCLLLSIIDLRFTINGGEHGYLKLTLDFSFWRDFVALQEQENGAKELYLAFLPRSYWPFVVLLLTMQFVSIRRRMKRSMHSEST
jgi:hypothetical protein